MCVLPLVGCCVLVCLVGVGADGSLVFVGCCLCGVRCLVSVLPVGCYVLCVTVCWLMCVLFVVCSCALLFGVGYASSVSCCLVFAVC